MRNLHVPVWLHAFNRPTTPTFVTLYTIEHLSRAMLVTVVPLAAYEHLGDVQLISMLYLGIGLSGLLASFAVPW
ncbi:MAG: MFS transporter, partial [Rhodospirillales bacterium]|nr:MFS transporter [Rhodospirillales bacterium]